MSDEKPPRSLRDLHRLVAGDVESFEGFIKALRVLRDNVAYRAWLGQLELDIESARETLVLAPGQPAGPVTDTGPAFWRGMVQGMRAALALAEQMERDLDARRTVRAVAQGRQ